MPLEPDSGVSMPVGAVWRSAAPGPVRVRRTRFRFASVAVSAHRRARGRRSLPTGPSIRAHKRSHTYKRCESCTRMLPELYGCRAGLPGQIEAENVLDEDLDDARLVAAAFDTLPEKHGSALGVE